MPAENVGGSVVVTGDAIGGFRANVILGAIRFYRKTGMKINRMYTPANMMKAAGDFTGKQYPRGKKGLEQAENDLAALVAGKTLDQIGQLER